MMEHMALTRAPAGKRKEGSPLFVRGGFPWCHELGAASQNSGAVYFVLDTKRL